MINLDISDDRYRDRLAKEMAFKIRKLLRCWGGIKAWTNPYPMRRITDGERSVPVLPPWKLKAGSSNRMSIQVQHKFHKHLINAKDDQPHAHRNSPLSDDFGEYYDEEYEVEMVLAHRILNHRFLTRSDGKDARLPTTQSKLLQTLPTPPLPSTCISDRYLVTPSKSITSYSRSRDLRFHKTFWGAGINTKKYKTKLFAL